MVGHGTAQDYCVARSSIPGRDVKLHIKQADTGCIDKNPVRLARLDNLGITSHYLDTCLIGAIFQRPNNGFQILIGKAFFNDHTNRKIERPGSPHGQVVNSAMYGEGTNIAAGEKNGINNKGIGAEGYFLSACLDDSAVLQITKRFTPKTCNKEFFYQIMRGPTAAAMR